MDEILMLFLEDEDNESRQLLAVYNDVNAARSDYDKLYEAGHSPRLVGALVQETECIDIADVSPVSVWDEK